MAEVKRTQTTPNSTFTLIGGEDATGVPHPFKTDTSGNLVVPASSSQSPGATGTLASVPASTTSVVVLASNANAKQRLVFNDSTSLMYLAFAATASSTSYTVQLPAGAYFEVPVPLYTGTISGVWVAANGNARVTEVTA